MMAPSRAFGVGLVATGAVLFLLSTGRGGGGGVGERAADGGVSSSAVVRVGDAGAAAGASPPVTVEEMNWLAWRPAPLDRALLPNARDDARKACTQRCAALGKAAYFLKVGSMLAAAVGGASGARTPNRESGGEGGDRARRRD